MSTSTPARLPSDVPERIGRYEILLPIASGGMATVYLARAIGPGGFATEVALKLTHAHLREDPDFSHDLLEEAKLVARIRHHNVVPVLDVGEDPRGIYLVMEYVEGDSLAGLFRRAGPNPMPRGIAARFVLDALEGLHAAHELRDASGQLLGLVHRDFTPHNILIGTDGVARLADFGIAKAATRLGNTRMGMVKGKIAYMPPEQARGMPLDRRCDVWAAGVVAWELLSGRRLHDADEDDVATLLKVATEAPPPLSSVAPGISAAVSAAVASALTMDLEKRCPTAAALGKSLGTALRASVTVAEPSEAAEWMMRLVGPKVSERRLAAAEIQARRSQTSITPAVARPLPEITAPIPTAARTLVTAEPTWQLPVPQTVTRKPTQAMPTRVLPEPEGKPTDAVAVVGHVRTRPFAMSPRRIGVATVAAVAIVLGVAAFRLTMGDHRDEATSVATSSPALPPAVTSAPPPTPFVPAPTIAPAPASHTTMHVHANAPVAAIAVDGRSVALTPGPSDGDIDLGTVDPAIAVTLDAMSTDGRRISIMIAPSVAAASLDFPAPTPSAAAPRPSPPPRPAPPPRQPPRAAPLAPSPYP